MSKLLSVLFCGLLCLTGCAETSKCLCDTCECLSANDKCGCSTVKQPEEPSDVVNVEYPAPTSY